MDQGFNRVAVFTATKARDRENLGDEVTKWLREYRGRVVDKVVTQSSDNEFHCLSITIFCVDGGNNKRRRSERGSDQKNGR
jgi:hypothetical protein